ncbi:MAG: hypothetical protein JST58_08595 [Bacteroidetes bacterium]|nr:hypothetical protein [Bacteroidota bacterium]
MKKHINLFKKLLLATLVIQPMLTWATGNEDGAEKRKTISKSYSVGSNDKLNIDNSFGDVIINIWDKNEFKVDIEIYAKGATDEKAQQIIDNIKINDYRSGNNISFKTHVQGTDNEKTDERNRDHDDSDDNGNNKNNYSYHKHNVVNSYQFHINYIVYMPSANPLQIINQFGKTVLPDFKGFINLTSKFGSLNSGNLDNVEAIDVEFGEAQIGDIHNGKLTFKFDGKCSVGKLSGSIKIINEFSDLVQYYVSNAIEELTISESYSSIRVIVPKDLSARFEIHTNFGDFKNNTDFNLSEKIEYGDDNNGIRFDKDYIGTVGDGKAKIKIKSSFGDIKLSHTALSKEEEEAAPQQKNNKKRKKEVEVS